jgi:hypothetical protein
MSWRGLTWPLRTGPPIARLPCAIQPAASVDGAAAIPVSRRFQRPGIPPAYPEVSLRKPGVSPGLPGVFSGRPVPFPRVSPGRATAFPGVSPGSGIRLSGEEIFTPLAGTAQDLPVINFEITYVSTRHPQKSACYPPAAEAVHRAIHTLVHKRPGRRPARGLLRTARTYGYAGAPRQTLVSAAARAAKAGPDRGAHDCG